MELNGLFAAKWALDLCQLSNLSQIQRQICLLMKNTFLPFVDLHLRGRQVVPLSPRDTQSWMMALAAGLLLLAEIFGLRISSLAWTVKLDLGYLLRCFSSAGFSPYLVWC